MMFCASTFVDHRRQTTYKCYNQYSTVEVLTTLDGPAVIDQILIESRFLPQLGGPRRNSAITFVRPMEKLE